MAAITDIQSIIVQYPDDTIQAIVVHEDLQLVYVGEPGPPGTGGNSATTLADLGIYLSVNGEVPPSDQMIRGDLWTVGCGKFWKVEFLPEAVAPGDIILIALPGDVGYVPALAGIEQTQNLIALAKSIDLIPVGAKLSITAPGTLALEAIPADLGIQPTLAAIVVAEATGLTALPVAIRATPTSALLSLQTDLKALPTDSGLIANPALLNLSKSLLSVSSNLSLRTTSPTIALAMLFDSFGGTSINTSLWDTRGGVYQQTNGKLVLGPPLTDGVASQVEAIRGSKFTKTNYTITAPITWNQWAYSTQIEGLYFITWDNSNNLKDVVYIGTVGSGSLIVKNAGSYTSSTLSTLSLNTEYTLKVQFNTTTSTLVVFLNGTQVLSVAFSSVCPNNSTATKITFGQIVGAQPGNAIGQISINSYEVAAGIL